MAVPASAGGSVLSLSHKGPGLALPASPLDPQHQASAAQQSLQIPSYPTPDSQIDGTTGKCHPFLTAEHLRLIPCSDKRVCSQMECSHQNSPTGVRDKPLPSSDMKGTEGKIKHTQEIPTLGSKVLQRHQQPIHERRFRGDPIDP